MFENPGSKIKTISKVLFVLSVIASIILAFIFGLGQGTFRVGLFFALLIGGPIGAYLVYLLIYGFGQLIENAEEE